MSGKRIAYSDRKDLPNIKGVYAVFNNQSCLYVGSSVTLRSRVTNHTRRKQFAEHEASYILYFEVDAVEDLIVKEIEKIKEYEPILNIIATRRSMATAKSKPFKDDPKYSGASSLRDVTFQMLKRKKAGLSLTEIAQNAKVPVSWLTSFYNGCDKKTPVNYIQGLYEYLSETKLTLISIKDSSQGFPLNHEIVIDNTKRPNRLSWHTSTLKLLRERNESITYEEISSATGINIHWLNSFESEKHEDPGVEKVGKLHDYLVVRAGCADLNRLVDKFLCWPLPESVCSDLCVTEHGMKGRIGTSLLTADEVRQMLEYLFKEESNNALES